MPRPNPNRHVDSSGSATYAAKTRELRALLLARGGVLDTYDLVWLGEDDEVVRRVAADPRSADSGCGGVLAAACTLGKRDLLVRLLEAGARVPPMPTACRSYLPDDEPWATALAWATRRGHGHIAEILRRAGAIR